MSQEIADQQSDEARHAQALAASEGRFRMLAEICQEGLLITDDNGCILYANPAAAALLGQPQAELPGQPCGFPLTPAPTGPLSLPPGNGQPQLVDVHLSETGWNNAPAWLVLLRPRPPLPISVAPEQHFTPPPPSTEPATLRFTDVVNTARLQQLMGLFYQATQIPIGIIDVDGTVLVGSGWQEICTRFHRVHPVTAARCRESDAYIQSHLNAGKYVQYKCQNGLWDIAIPIIVEGRQLATLFVGQFFYADEQPDEAFFRAQAEQFGFDVEAYLAALKRIRVFTREQIHHIMEYYAEFARLLAELGHKNLLLARDMARRQQAELALAETEQRFRALIEHATDIIIVIGPDRQIHYVSPSVKWILGYDPDQATQSNWLAILAPEEIAKIRLVAAQALQHPELSFPIEVQVRHRDGSWRVLEGTVQSRMEDPAVNGTIVILHDATHHRRTEAALSRARDFYLSLLDKFPSPIWRTTPNGKINYVNQAWMELTGYSLEQARGDGWLEALHPEDQQRCLESYLEAFHARQPIELEYRLRRHDGTYRRVLDLAHPFTDPEGQFAGYLGILYDLTERYEAGRALQESRDLLNSIFRAAPVGIGLVANRIILEANDRLCAMVGYTREELVGQSARLLYPTQEEFEWVGTEKYRQIAERGTGTVETRWITQAGQLLNVLLSSTPLDPHDLGKGVTFTALDITARRQAEATLMESEALQRALLQALPDQILLLDREGRIQDYHTLHRDNQLLPTTGFQHRHYTDLLPPEMSIPLSDLWSQVWETGQIQQFEYPFPDETGQPHYYEARLTLCGADKLLCIVRDVTDREQARQQTKRLIAELQATNRQLHESNRLKTLFAEAISYESGNPLSIMQGYTDLLAESLRDAGCLSAVQAIQTQIAALRQIIQDANHYIRLDALGDQERAPTDLNDLFRAVLRELEPVLAAANLQVNYAPQSPQVAPVSPALISYLFNRLLNNAIKNSPPGGRIAVNIVELSQVFRIYIKDWGQRDMGEKKTGLATRLEQDEWPSLRNHALGLTILRRIVVLHHGRLWWEENPEGGNLFCLELPKS